MKSNDKSNAYLLRRPFIFFHNQSKTVGLTENSTSQIEAIKWFYLIFNTIVFVFVFQSPILLIELLV